MTDSATDPKPSQSLILRSLPVGMLDRIRAFGQRRGLGLRTAAIALLEMGLRSHDRAIAAGKARGKAVTPEEAQRASQARWAKKAGNSGD